MKLREIASNARIELLEPMVNRPSRRYLLNLATINVQSFFNQIQSTGHSWAICDNPLILNVNAGQSEYILPVGDDWGRALDVTCVDPANPSNYERQVTFSELGDRAYSDNDDYYDGPERISFYKKGFSNDTYASVRPAPNTSRTYRIVYSLGSWASDMALDDSPLLAQHHGLLVVKTSLDALPASAWWAGDEKENRLRRNELKDSLSARLPILMSQFQSWVRSISQPRMTSRLLYSIE